VGTITPSQAGNIRSSHLSEPSQLQQVENKDSDHQVDEKGL